MSHSKITKWKMSGNVAITGMSNIKLRGRVTYYEKDFVL